MEYLVTSVRDPEIPDVKYYWDKLVAGDLVKWAFFDGTVLNLQEFKGMIVSPYIGVFFVLDKPTQTPIAAFHLTGQMGLTYQIHFSFLREYFKDAEEISAFTLNMVFEKLPVSALLGLTPVVNRPAVALLKKSGFEVITIIPKGYWWNDKKKYVDSVASMRVNHGISQSSNV